jgi:hypothetical protein
MYCIITKCWDFNLYIPKMSQCCTYLGMWPFHKKATFETESTFKARTFSTTKVSENPFVLQIIEKYCCTYIERLRKLITTRHVIFSTKVNCAKSSKISKAIYHKSQYEILCIINY